ncbi:Hypothetical protein PHPALM_19511 [Phytophthora palmivora]|uniref:Uncharacterized protein n=1 Tax=Phytophthora palmivora TaxID=4796 RepID=A0A2P4XH60_9STRA|nr:Hypothetical protein PHPALM_19511 [Phytophthora palmivora]
MWPIQSNCHSQPEQHHFKPRSIASYYDKVLSSEGHTGILCHPSLPVSAQLLQVPTRFRFTAPANLERLRADVDAVVKYHQQQLLQQQQQQQQQQR